MQSGMRITMKELLIGKMRVCQEGFINLLSVTTVCRKVNLLFKEETMEATHIVAS